MIGRHLRLLAYTVLVAFGLPAPAHAQPRPSSGELARFFDHYIGSAVREADVPGASLVVVRDGQVILTKGYGYADLARRIPMSPERHLLRQGSVSKIATWLMVMQLVQQGQLNLDRDINVYLPFRIDYKFGTPITLRHLMTHSAGFSERFMGVYSTPKEPLCDTLRKNLPTQIVRPGTRVSYSNSGAGLAACILEQVTRRPFARLVQDRVLDPAGMTSSTFEQPVPAGLRGRLAKSYQASSQTPHAFEMLAIPPAGALSATGADMGRLLQALTDTASSRQGLLSSSAIKEMGTLQRPLARGLPAGMGLGFVVREQQGVRYFGHGGTLFSGISDLEILPDQGLGWYIGMNGLGTGGSAKQVREDLTAAVINRFFVNQAGAWPVRGPSTAAEAAGSWLFGRRYRSGPLKISDLNLVNATAEQDGSLRIDAVRDAYGNAARWLPSGRDRFVQEGTGVPLVLVRNDGGRVVRLASAVLSPVSDLERAPAWLTWALPLLASASLVLLAAAVWHFAARLRWRLRPSPLLPVQRSQQRWKMLAGAALGWLLTTALGWMVLIGFVSDNPYLLGDSGGLIRSLGAMALLNNVAAALLVACALRTFAEPGVWRRAGLLMVATAAVTLTGLFDVLGLASTSLDF